jgi:hypothetical protein
MDANLEIPLKSKDGCVETLICKFRELIEAVQEGNNVCSKKLKLVGEVFWVKLFKDYRLAYVRRCFRASSSPPRNNVRFYDWVCGLMRNFSREEVRCVFMKEPYDLGKALPEMESRRQNTN